MHRTFWRTGSISGAQSTACQWLSPEPTPEHQHDGLAVILQAVLVCSPAPGAPVSSPQPPPPPSRNFHMEVAVRSDNIRNELAQASLPKGRMLCYTSEMGESRALTARKSISRWAPHFQSTKNINAGTLFSRLKEFGLSILNTERMFGLAEIF